MPKPIIGEMNRKSNILPSWGNRMACIPAEMATAPVNPPIKACEELQGNPRYAVRMIHASAPIMAARMTVVFKSCGLTTTRAMVFATAIPKTKGPLNSAKAVKPIAVRCDSAREEIMVATMLLESLAPLRNA